MFCPLCLINNRFTFDFKVSEDTHFGGKVGFGLTHGYGMVLAEDQLSIEIKTAKTDLIYHHLPRVETRG